MEQFNLATWLKDKSRRVVTRLKKSVQIISIEGKEDIPIVALVDGVAHQYKPNGYHTDVIVAYSNQCRDMRDYDLFFADDELTEFESKLYSTFSEIWQDYMLGREIDVAEVVKDNSNELLDLAKKEILTSLPMWEKCDDNLEYSHIGGFNNRYLIKNGYCIKISDLETLSKKE